jgi:hypothetical protein
VPSGALDLADVGQVLAALAAGLDLLLDQVGVADDRVERGPQLVAHVGQEGALGPARGLGGGARLLEVGVELGVRSEIAICVLSIARVSRRAGVKAPAATLFSR